MSRSEFSTLPPADRDRYRQDYVSAARLSEHLALRSTERYVLTEIVALYEAGWDEPAVYRLTFRNRSSGGIA
jgi:hypothetical protein